MFKFKFFLAALILVVVNSCREEEPTVASKGYLSLQISAITIDASPAGGRTKAVSTDDFIVKIFQVGEVDPILVFDPWSSAPAQIELETGEYYVEAQNLETPEPAAFDQPWYYGVSDNFTVDKEELKEISLECNMANSKVSFHYSENVEADFTNWTATVTRSVSEQSLTWPMGETREGYFLIGEPLTVHVHLEYDGPFEEDELITRDFYATIEEPAAETLYNLNVNAVLQNGQIQLQITVDEGLETVEIPMGDDQEGGG